MVLIYIITCILIFWLWFPLLSTLVALVGNEEKPVERSADIDQLSDFACIITVYKNLEIATPLVDSLLQQNYENYHIYLIADRVEEQSFAIEDQKLIVFYPAEPLNSKVRSLDYALEHVVRKHTHVLVFDPDNLAHPEALNVINIRHQSGFKAVQGKRIAKNIDSTYAALDALGEHYYDFYARKMPYIIGSSSTIAGSGMSIDFDLYMSNIKREMVNLQKEGIVVSEDKALQLELVSDGHRIAYEEKAIIFDEKVDQAEQVSRQRTRWLNSYFRHLGDVFPVLLKGLFTGNFNQFYFGLNTMMPPLVILFGGTVIMFFIVTWFSIFWGMALLLSLMAFALNFLISLGLNHTPLKVWQAIPKIPLFAFNQVLAILKIQKANKDFMQTSHTHQLSFEETWSKRKQDFKHLFPDG